jgi:hypothetical protein
MKYRRELIKLKTKEFSNLFRVEGHYFKGIKALIISTNRGTEAVDKNINQMLLKYIKNKSINVLTNFCLIEHLHFSTASTFDR